VNKIDSRVHSQVAELLSAYIDGQVSAAERTLVERHLAACPACTRDLMALRRTVLLLNHLPPIAAARPFTLSQAQVAPARPGPWRWVFGVPGLASGLAALLCVVAVGGLALVGRLAPGGVLIPAAMAPAPPGTRVAYEQPRTAQEAVTIQAAVPTPAPESGPGATVTSVAKYAAPSEELQAAGQPPTAAVEAPGPASGYQPPAATAITPPTVLPAPTAGIMAESQTQPGSEGIPVATPTVEEPTVVHEKALPAVLEATPTAPSTPTRAPEVATVAPRPATAKPKPVATASPTAAAARALAPAAAPTEAAAPALTPTAPPTAAAALVLAPTASAPGPEPPLTPAETQLTTAPEKSQADQQDTVRQSAGAAAETAPAGTPGAEANLMPVADLNLEVESGVIRVSGRLPLPEGQHILAELWRDNERTNWAIPETQRTTVEADGRFALELEARPGSPDSDLFSVAPARYEIRIAPVEPAAPIEARIPFDTFPPPQQ